MADFVVRHSCRLNPIGHGSYVVLQFTFPRRRLARRGQQAIQNGLPVADIGQSRQTTVQRIWDRNGFASLQPNSRVSPQNRLDQSLIRSTLKSLTYCTFKNEM